MLESCEYRPVRELAEAEKINSSSLGRILRLTLLAPDIVGAILDGCRSLFPSSAPQHQASASG